MGIVLIRKNVIERVTLIPFSLQQKYNLIIIQLSVEVIWEKGWVGIN